MDAYAIDTCSLLELKRSYPQDLFPSVWEIIRNSVERKMLISSQEVFKEILGMHDEVLDFAKSVETMFVKTDENIQNHVTSILRSCPGLVNLKSNKSHADPFLIAVAIQHRAVVVTQEKSSRNSNKPKIPDACLIHNINCINFVEMLRALNFRA